MSKIVTEATFRGNIVEKAVSQSTGGLPQFVAKLVATEAWEPDIQDWVDWTPYDENEITGYFILYSKKNEPTLNATQVMEATGWDGQSFAVLDGCDLSDCVVQFRVENHTYDQKTSLQVTWIDKFDAIPGMAIKKMDANDIKALDAQYAKFKPKAAKVVAKPKAVAPAKPKPAASGIVTKTAKKIAAEKAEADAAKVAANAGQAAGAPAMPAPPETAAEAAAEETGSITQDEAWTQTINTLRDQGVDDGKISEVWLAQCDLVGPDQKAFSEEQWYQVFQGALSGAF